MHSFVPRRLTGGLLASTLVVGLAACGSSSSSSSSSSTPAKASAPAAKKIKVGLVTDIGGLNDRGFNALANQGLTTAEKTDNVTGRVLESKSAADYVPNLSSLAQQGNQLVIGVGFLMADAMATVAKKYPNTKFAIIDVDTTTLKGKPSNVTGLLFKEQEAGYLAGTIAGLYAKDNKAKAVSTIGGIKLPAVDHYIAGFDAAAKKVDPGIKTPNAYSQSFTDQAKCKELALDQIGQGSKVVFQVAGACGLGALDAAKEKGVQGIGVDADQSYLGNEIITSAVKKVDVSVETAIKQAQSNTLKGGVNLTFDTKNGGVGIGKISPAGQAYQAQVKSTMADLVSGKIVPPDTVSSSK